jgi:hypothetical protein
MLEYKYVSDPSIFGHNHTLVLPVIPFDDNAMELEALLANLIKNFQQEKTFLGNISIDDDGVFTIVYCEHKADAMKIKLVFPSY